MAGWDRYGLRDFDRKLRLTAALLGATTRKELARAFHRINPNTAFDVDRAAKWLQGRAHPRNRTLYEDWAGVLDLDRPVAWLLESDPRSFAMALGRRHGIEVEALERGAAAFGHRRPSVQRCAGSPDRPDYLCGSFVCYRHAFSPYFEGRILRGSLRLERRGGGAPIAFYQESLPTGRVGVAGSAAASGRSLFLDMASASARNERAFISLFMPQPPGSCLAGIYCSCTLMSPHGEPASSRFLAVRIPSRGLSATEAGDRYMAIGESIADDLVDCGLAVADRGELDNEVDRFLRGATASGCDRIIASVYDLLAQRFDRHWLATLAR